MERGLLGVVLLELVWVRVVHGFQEAGADPVRDGRDQPLLGRFSCIIYSEYVLLLSGLGLINLLDHPCQVFHVNGWDEILADPEVGQR